MSEQSSIKPPRPSWWRWLWVGGGALVVVAIVVTALFVVPAIQEAARSCGDGVEERGENSECTGITDGSYIYSAELRDVEQRIHKENKDVAESGDPYVSIAVFLPMTLADNDIVSMEWVRHQLQGAYLAQYRANNTKAWGGETPRIKLLLANPGSRLAHWEPVVAELGERRRTDHLVAVTGVGLSLDSAREAMRRLSALRIPVIASHLAADDLSKIPGFLRVSPTSTTYAKAAATYIKESARTAMIVQDQNVNDLYPRTLAEAFSETFADKTHEIVGRTEFYDSDLPGVQNTFLQMMPNLCVTQPDVVYFAGRENDLSSFVAQLASRKCGSKEVIVLTGDLALTGEPGPDMLQGLESGVTVLGPGLAHPDAWAEEPGGTFNKASVEGFRKVGCSLCYEKIFPEDRLDDGVAILAHDAVFTAIWAVRNSAVHGGQVTAGEVLQIRNRLNGELAVPGASGALEFDQRGDPVNQAIPILRVRLHDTPEYVTMSSPTGR